MSKMKKELTEDDGNDEEEKAEYDNANGAWNQRRSCINGVLRQRIVVPITYDNNDGRPRASEENDLDEIENGLRIRRPRVNEANDLDMNGNENNEDENNEVENNEDENNEDENNEDENNEDENNEDENNEDENDLDENKREMEDDENDDGNEDESESEEQPTPDNPCPNHFVMTYVAEEERMCGDFDFGDRIFYWEYCNGKKSGRLWNGAVGIVADYNDEDGYLIWFNKDSDAFWFDKVDTCQEWNYVTKEWNWDKLKISWRVETKQIAWDGLLIPEGKDWDDHIKKPNLEATKSKFGKEYLKANKKSKRRKGSKKVKGKRGKGLKTGKK